jgi:hypothetical protein
LEQVHFLTDAGFSALASVYAIVVSTGLTSCLVKRICF